MLIRDLPAPVTASKADWLPGTAWLGFTPQGKGPDAVAKCESAVQRQMGNGYVLERITQNFGDPNPGFEDDPIVARDRKAHEELKDRLVAVHRARHSMRPLREIIGDAEFERLQDIWSVDHERKRWSVAFPIIETYQIVGQPLATKVFSEAVFRKIYRKQFATLRSLDDEARSAIANLEIKRIDAPSAWVALEDEISMAERSSFPGSIEQKIEQDLAGALEGQSAERRAKLKKRAAWLANKFAMDRRDSGKLFCDECGFDPQKLPGLDGITLRSCFDVHHKDPLAEGVRYTTVQDFSLLCPTCHRIEHLKIKRDSG